MRDCPETGDVARRAVAIGAHAVPAAPRWRRQSLVVVPALSQAHTFEDRVLKLDRITVRAKATVGRAALPLCGADVGENTYVAPQSAVMKGEPLLPNRVYVGRPTRPVQSV